MVEIQPWGVGAENIVSKAYVNSMGKRMYVGSLNMLAVVRVH